MRRLLILLIVGIGVTFLGTACSTPAIRYTIQSDANGKCMTLNPEGASYSVGTSVVQWDCNSTFYHWNKLMASWNWYKIGQDANKQTLYQVKSILSGKCMEVSLSNGGKNDGDVVQQATCNGGKNQQWLYNNVATSGKVVIMSVHSGKCIQVSLDESNEIQKQDGVAIEQWVCTVSATNQFWIMSKTNDPPPPYDSGKGELCDACNPDAPACGTGAKCLVLTTGQNVCGKACGGSVSCPSGYQCMTIKTLKGNIQQCSPVNDRCP